MNNIEVVINGRVDRDMIDAAIAASENMYITVKNNYTAPFGETAVLVNELNASYLEAFKKVIDYCSYKVEQGGYYFLVEKVNKNFSLQNSYYRNEIDTSSTHLPIPGGKALLFLFEIPGFGISEIIPVSAWFGTPFLQDDIDLLATKGITLTGDGDVFEIENVVPVRLKIVKPEVVTDKYIIINNFENETI
jgi:hypothetical protein